MNACKPYMDINRNVKYVPINSGKTINIHETACYRIVGIGFEED